MASIKDIAKMAGVSTATVSHVINKTRYVSPELVDKVESAIKNADSPPKFVVRRQKRFVKVYINLKKEPYYIFVRMKMIIIPEKFGRNLRSY